MGITNNTHFNSTMCDDAANSVLNASCGDESKDRTVVLEYGPYMN